MRGVKLISVLGLAGATVALTAPDARACGGTFCDVGPQAMPVDQTGENILFVIDGGFVEAHVQIQYSGDPARFAWVVPMPAVPAVSVGSQALFDALLQSTVPTYGFTTQRDQCGQPMGSPASGFGGSAGTSFSGSPPSDNAGPTIVFQKTVGAFEATGLQGGTAQEVVDWLNTNGFQQIETAPALLDRYVQENFVFVAIKLTAGAGISEIHPLVFRYEGSEPCVPLRLTAVAASNDMGVRTFFLGDERVVPTNYRHVTLNPIQINWQSFGSNYNTVVSRAADSEGADGHGFVTEYAGQSSIVARSFANPSWDSSRFTGIDPVRVISELEVQSLLWCDSNVCQYNHPMILPILQDFLPRPAGVTDEQFYSCLDCLTVAPSLCYCNSELNVAEWNELEFITALEERIIQPARHAEDLLASMPYLTRMFTTISPDEMTVDPMFYPAPNLDDVVLPTTATQRIYCNGLTVFELPSGEQVALEGGSWPDFSDLPYAATVEQFSADGQRVLVADNTRAIDKELDQHNADLGLDDSSGCGCTVPGRRAPHGALAALGLAAAAALARRRCARRSAPAK